MPWDTPYTALPKQAASGVTHFATVSALAAIGFVSGVANGYNGTILEGAIPRLWAVHALTSTLEVGTFGCMMSVGGLVGSLACTEVAYRLSRRSMVVLGEMVIISGVVLFAVAPMSSLRLTGRLLTGIGIGICGLAKPLIVSELAPAEMRGMLVSLFAVGQSVGMNVMYVVDWLLPPPTVEWAWRVGVLIGGSPAVIVVILAALTPRSCYWDVVPSSLPDAKRATSEDTALQQFRRMFTFEPWELRRNFLLIVALMFGYNLSGTLIIANYASQILAAAGTSNRALPIIIGLVQFLGLISATFGSDRFGRRPLLLFSCALSSGCLFAIAALLTQAGSVLGSALTPLLLSLMVAVEYAVGAGLNPIRIILSAELMPSRYRSFGMSLGNAVGWGIALLSLFLFPVLSAVLHGPAPQFAFFGIVVSLLTILLSLQLPETKGIDFDSQVVAH
mmetsp:Transcript_5646/g.9460  ORF Transcript_5646/g.9460 Transcript_5646/m.9460 type:complete len:447 (-) Transcript_5646:380-1720(-)|eukprot:CAMPEP_0119328142 /NCGR_PEP_ID=MMETSP1333-20130426/72555_1 /TAXON_ID=418940 /ORGANISM="Scyphosphaera apsteinii, Strain RCC1455" /LENGTH=446 /DNA_ID=CAMNT_0007336915 /DNA_START=41 /DNA_END=1381 /DNA_ORIENTATION=-